MTQKEHYDHLLLVLINHKNHSIVRHRKLSGEYCYRIRDENANPIANIPEGIFDKFKQNELLIKVNEREYTLDTSKINKGR